MRRTNAPIVPQFDERMEGHWPPHLMINPDLEDDNMPLVAGKGVTTTHG